MNTVLTLQGLLLFWAFMSRALFAFLRSWFREGPLRKGSPSVPQSTCKILGAVIVEQSTRNPGVDGWEFVPNIEYVFPDDPARTRHSLEEAPPGMDLIQAHRFLSRWLPEGTPFDLKPMYTKYQKPDPDRTGPLELYLTLEEMDYFRNIQWKPQVQPVLAIRHLQGDFRTNEINLLARFEGSLAAQLAASFALMAGMVAVLYGFLDMRGPRWLYPVFLLEFAVVAIALFLWPRGRLEPNLSSKHRPSFRIDGDSIGKLLK